MDDIRSTRRRRMAVPIILLHLIYFALFLLSLKTVSAETVMASLLLVVVSSLVYGVVWGFVSGLSIGLVQIVSLAFQQDFGLSIASIQLTAMVVNPDLLHSALLPIFGLLTGYLAEITGVRSTHLEREARELQISSQSQASRLERYEKQFQDLSTQKLYQRSWDQLLSSTGQSEEILSLLIASTSPSPKIRFPLADTSAPPAASAHKLFDLLLHVRPEILAVFSPDGKIIQLNEQLMALYGYPPEKRAKILWFTDLLVADDAGKAAANMARAVKSELQLEEHYRMRSIDGGFSKLLIPSHVTINSVGNPLTLIACIGKPNDRFAITNTGADEYQPKDVADLTGKTIACLSADHVITYISPAVAALLGTQPEIMVGKKCHKYVSSRQIARLDAFLNHCQAGRLESLEIEMMAHKGKRTVLRLTGYPGMGTSGVYLGTALLIEDITSVILVEEALKHRLSMEKLISSVSTRFISVRAEDLDLAIEDVIRMVGDFEEAEESMAEIFQSQRIRNQAKYHVINKKVSSRPRSDIGYGQTSESDRYETINIPIVIESEPLGYFRFYLEQYRTNWFETDLELIRLIGEIIINALIRKENELEIKLNETRLATTLQSIGDAVIATDTAGRIIVMNRKAEILTGWNRDKAYFKMLGDVFAPIDDPNPVEPDGPDLQNLHRFSETDCSKILMSADGRQYDISINRNPIEDLNRELFGEVIVFRDVTLEKQENDEIRYISYHDKLTGLYNRAFFEEELARLNTHRQYPITLILGDCNGLKIANDIFGHLEGDRLLQTIADILRKATRHEDIVARWGGDEFAIILPRTDEQSAASFRDRILQLCAEADSDPIQPSLALGSATNTDRSDDLVGLLKLAEDRMYRHKLMEGKSARSSILMSIEKMIYEKSFETEEHAMRLSDISLKIGQAVGLADYELEELSLLSVLHDMGKIGIPDHILLKPEQLSKEEWDIMKKHSEKGYNLAKSTPELNSIADSILHHHERWDGTGYPTGLRGEEIPKLSRILAIVDAYDVITHSRVYKKAQSKNDALQEIEKCAGTQFDPYLTQLFIQMMSE